MTISAPTHSFKIITNCALTYRKEYGIVNQGTNLAQKRTFIGNDVTIIVEGSIGAGAVVTKDVLAYEIWDSVSVKKSLNDFNPI